MGTLTLNARIDLTYEEIYEGYENGKSRLPKVLKDIAIGSNAIATLAGTTGVNIFRRRADGHGSVTGNAASNATGTVRTFAASTPVAVLITTARYNALKDGYDPEGGAPSEYVLSSDVRGVAKNPFDLIDIVSGVNHTFSAVGATGTVAVGSRAVKIETLGSNVVTRNFNKLITTEIGTDGLDVRALFGDRVGGGGATGEVHGEDVGIPDIIATDGEASIIGNTGATFNMTGATALSIAVDGQSPKIATYLPTIQTMSEIIANTNAQLDGECYALGEQIAIKSNAALQEGFPHRSILVHEANTVLGFGLGVSTGPTAESTQLTGENTLIELDAGHIGGVTNIRYGTYQFGTLQVFNSTNDTAPVAYFVHPDLMSDLIANSP